MVQDHFLLIAYISALARDLVLSLAVGSVHAPVSLIGSFAVVTNAVWLPWLIEGLEEENIDTPGEHAADTLFMEDNGIIGTSLGITVVASAVYKYTD